MRLLDLGCGSGAAAYYLASRRDIEIVCVTNSSVQADICQRKLAKLDGRGQVIVTDFDSLDLPSDKLSTPSMRWNRSATPKIWTLGWGALLGACSSREEAWLIPLTRVVGSLSA